MDYKVIVSATSVILVFVGYVPYIHNIIKRKVVPHAFTFLVWGLAGSITWALQVYGGAGVGAWTNFCVSAVIIFIFLLSLKYGEKSIKALDVVFLVLALISLFLWLVIKQPVWSVILIVLTDILGFGPTIRKSWKKPNQEGLFTWWMAGFRHALSILALERFNLLTLLHPITWSATNVIFCIILIARRKMVSRLR